MDIKILLIMGLLSFGVGEYINAQNKQENSNVKELGNVPKENVDSYVYKNESRPVYYAKYGNRGCLFELRINDMLTDELTRPRTIGETSTTINPAILKSGKQTVTVRLYPFPGETSITNENPFRLEIGYIDFAIEANEDEIRPWNVTFTLPPVEVPDEGLPYIELTGEFEATVPYQVKGCSDCIDLRTLPDIEERVVKEYKYVRELIALKNTKELREYFTERDYELGITLYESANDIDNFWSTNIKSELENYTAEELQPIEDYRLVFSGNGRSVSLRSKKKKGKPSALLFIKQEDGNPNFEYYCIELHLGIKIGTNKLTAIIM